MQWVTLGWGSGFPSAGFLLACHRSLQFRTFVQAVTQKAESEVGLSNMVTVVRPHPKHNLSAAHLYARQWFPNLLEVLETTAHLNTNRCGYNGHQAAVPPPTSSSSLFNPYAQSPICTVRFGIHQNMVRPRPTVREARVSQTLSITISASHVLFWFVPCLLFSQPRWEQKLAHHQIRGKWSWAYCHRCLKNLSQPCQDLFFRIHHLALVYSSL